MNSTENFPGKNDFSSDRFFLRQSYQGKPAQSDERQSDERGHWQGGEPRHEDAKCPLCKRPLLLLWDIDFRDPRFSCEDAFALKSMDRLPFYYCWRCSIDMSYQVVDGNRIVIHELSPHCKGEPDYFPYENFPEFFPRQPLALEPIPYEIENLLLAFQEYGDDRMKESDLAKIADWVGEEEVRYISDAWRHQLGGLPFLAQEPETLRCANKSCPHSKRDKDDISDWLKQLAVIHNDPMSGLPMVETKEEVIEMNKNFEHKQSKGIRLLANSSTQVVYYICNWCLTLRVFNRCD